MIICCILEQYALNKCVSFDDQYQGDRVKLIF